MSKNTRRYDCPCCLRTHLTAEEHKHGALCSACMETFAMAAPILENPEAQVTREAHRRCFPSGERPLMQTGFRPHPPTYRALADYLHRQGVRYALRHGHQVRPEVIADYPDLATPAMALAEEPEPSEETMDRIRAAEAETAELVSARRG